MGRRLVAPGVDVVESVAVEVEKKQEKDVKVEAVEYRAELIANVKESVNPSRIAD